ncbi:MULTISPECIES: hypothetical protein [Streptomyces]|uniref:hypothetical protein n=1 Tax=Streptomyces TaxID=1883 RepID=UPI0006AED55C|nr:MULTISPECIES: hypothetical protein [unclassified Streptomyces]KOU71127.1 hypothetical protein ADK61_31805 [Streptomyces sp. XY66]KOV26987.1 hypothetical protein ADK90_03100 [Streptomyces sp. XY413]
MRFRLLRRRRIPGQGEELVGVAAGPCADVLGIGVRARTDSFGFRVRFRAQGLGVTDDVVVLAGRGSHPSVRGLGQTPTHQDPRTVQGQPIAMSLGADHTFDRQPACRYGVGRRTGTSACKQERDSVTTGGCLGLRRAVETGGSE